MFKMRRLIQLCLLGLIAAVVPLKGGLVAKRDTTPTATQNQGVSTYRYTAFHNNSTFSNGTGANDTETNPSEKPSDSPVDDPDELTGKIFPIVNTGGFPPPPAYKEKSKVAKRDTTPTATQNQGVSTYRYTAFHNNSTFSNGTGANDTETNPSEKPSDSPVDDPDELTGKIFPIVNTGGFPPPPADKEKSKVAKRDTTPTATQNQGVSTYRYTPFHNNSTFSNGTGANDTETNPSEKPSDSPVDEPDEWTGKIFPIMNTFGFPPPPADKEKSKLSEGGTASVPTKKEDKRPEWVPDIWHGFDSENHDFEPDPTNKSVIEEGAKIKESRDANMSTEMTF
ncbi:altered inheritance of mitochondria protein 21-like isoform X3 [Cheilinus undulatus]|uniref:altered inheritance of mitochondria protein 21-like isoform X2 n=1 Tax=Cheilinus undulatus TaxID=241271 RepID=UPI001BD22100|nr:altered inheritance of mitochondria protein 21-like isoform X2 [Cheilinus undulatus]XP_041669853.1 altered inheritance of mitochondria protein 21-like isoform X3 [Cheilinus undulatus]